MADREEENRHCLGVFHTFKQPERPQLLSETKNNLGADCLLPFTMPDSSTKKKSLHLEEFIHTVSAIKKKKRQTADSMLPYNPSNWINSINR